MPQEATEAPSAGRVLVVDDDEAVLRGFARALRAQGYAVDTAPTGVAAVNSIAERRYDAVVSDISMPELDGMALLRHVRTADADLPVILVTGDPTLHTAIDAVGLGATHYLTKPVEPRHLTVAVEHAVRLRRLADLKRQLARVTGETQRIGDLLALDVRFNGALDGLHMLYQPLVSWSERKVVGYEALVRSSAPDLCQPGALFDAAERLDRLKDLGRSIRALCPAPMPWAADDVLLFVNLHTRDLLDPSLYESKAPLSRIADRVVLEITERAKLEQVDDISGRVARLRKRGFRIAIDDIGAGYAGLTSFAQLEPEFVKLDMALVRNVDQLPTKQRLVRSLCELCDELGMRVIAEGIETRAERDAVVELGCDWLQGYLFAKPSPPFVVPPTEVLPPIG